MEPLTIVLQSLGVEKKKGARAALNMALSMSDMVKDGTPPPAPPSLKAKTPPPAKLQSAFGAGSN